VTNLEFLRTASETNVAKFLLTNDTEEPDDWDKEMRECIHWLRDEFEYNSFRKYLSK